MIREPAPSDPFAVELCQRVDANELQRASISELGCLVVGGYKSIDIKVRKDGREFWFEADWLAQLFRP